MTILDYHRGALKTQPEVLAGKERNFEHLAFVHMFLEVAFKHVVLEPNRLGPNVIPLPKQKVLRLQVGVLLVRLVEPRLQAEFWRCTSLGINSLIIRLYLLLSLSLLALWVLVLCPLWLHVAIIRFFGLFLLHYLLLFSFSTLANFRRHVVRPRQHLATLISIGLHLRLIVESTLRERAFVPLGPTGATTILLIIVPLNRIRLVHFII